MQPQEPVVQELIRDALQCLPGIPSARDRFFNLLSIASVQIDADDRAGALSSCLSLMQIADALPDPLERPGYYRYVQEKMLVAGDREGANVAVTRAVDALQALNDENDEYHVYRDSSLVSIAQCMSEIGDFTRAKEQAASIVDLQYRSQVFTNIANAAAKAGRSEEAQTALQEAGHLRLAIELESSRFSTLSAIGEAQVALGQYEAARQTAGSITDLQYRDGILLNLIRDYLAKDPPDIGASDAALASLQYPLYACFAIREVALAEMQQGRQDAAVRRLPAARAYALKEDDDWRLSELAELVEVQVAAGDPAGARETMNAMLPKGLLGTDFGGSLMQKPEQRSLTHQNHARALAALDDLDAARQTLAHVEDADAREKILAQIAAFQAQRNHIPTAKQIAGEIHGPSNRADALTCIAGAILKPLYKQVNR